MKSTGIVRKLDNLGRVVIPKELRDTMNVGIRDSMEIYVEGQQIILKKYEPLCIFCGNAEGIVNYMGRNICRTCLDKIYDQMNKQQ